MDVPHISAPHSGRNTPNRTLLSEYAERENEVGALRGACTSTSPRPPGPAAGAGAVPPPAPRVPLCHLEIRPRPACGLWSWGPVSVATPPTVTRALCSPPLIAGGLLPARRRSDSLEVGLSAVAQGSGQPWESTVGAGLGPSTTRARLKITQCHHVLEVGLVVFTEAD